MPKRIISTAALIAMAVIPAAAQEPLVFDEPVEIDNVSGVDQPDVAAGQNGRWIAVWRRVSSENEIELYAAQSADLGATWSAPRLMHRTADRYVRTPRIVAGSEGHWAVVFQSAANEQSDGELHIAHSFDDAATWTEPVRFDNDMLVDQRFHTSMEIAINTSGEWLATWANRERGGLACISLDEGRSWSPPREFTPTAHSGSVDGVALPGGRWLIAWSTTGIRLTVSSDGAIWSELPPIAHPESAKPFYAPTLSVDRNGLLLLCYLQDSDELIAPSGGDLPPARYAQRSADGGLTWTPASGVSDENASFNANGGRVLNLGPDDWLTLGRVGWLRATAGGKWVAAYRPSYSFSTRAAADGLGNFMAVRVGFNSEALFIKAVHFGLPDTDNDLSDDSDSDSQDSPVPEAPGWPCPLAAAVLLAAGPVILLAGRRRRVH